MEEERQEKRIFYLTYGMAVAGVVIGSLLYLSDLLFFHAGYFRHGVEKYSPEVIMKLPIEQIAVYILKQRSEQILLFILGIFLVPCGIVTSIYSMVFGAFYGISVCSILVRYGMKGLPYGLACFLPHYLFYFVAMYYLGKWYYEKQEGKYKYHPNVNFLQSFVKFVVIFLLILSALVWEIRFQKNILNFFYQYLVS